ncbi:hypothetical protein GOEFS_019_00400 [Gordonia effusa NBRC 100432]|uniref:Uncharacterized protein n=1 Tax=Gordonia effusa NBRC 100432 TaxID=1077974 RepID=H0QWC6_9ACTN|nr:hypothetical protein [Gordonia effusa]GAB17127.1 hypothetical protein GOEFS_019_00400 [Gordonia effusa NBRC 100432]
MAELSDDQVVAILDKAVTAINPVLDLLADRDVLGLKKHTYHPWPDGPRTHQAIHLASTPLDFADWPGTAGWSELSMKARAEWWVTRIGALNTVGVAFPSVFGFWARYLPVTSLLGFANQAIVLVAIAREYEVTEPKYQVELLASVLCGRDVDAHRAGTTTSALPASGRSLIATVWNVAQTLRSLSGELDRRPGPAKPFEALRLIPIIGGPFSYLGERLALSRAASLGRRWIVDHPDSISPAAN